MRRRTMPTRSCSITFPILLEHIELVTRIGDVKLKRIIFRKASRTHGYFLSSNAHARLDMFDAIGLQVYWYDELTKDLYLHTYKKEHGFFVREEIARRFQESHDPRVLRLGRRARAGRHRAHFVGLVDKLTGFFGHNLGVLTGGGGGVMRLATDQARAKGALTGACFLELEAQPPELGVDFFNTFQESSRHFRQKWFEAADFCIFNVGGVGTLEEIGIEMCNLKLGIRPRVPYVFFNARFWGDLRRQLRAMIRTQTRAGLDGGLHSVHRRSGRGRGVLPEKIAGAVNPEPGSAEDAQAIVRA